MYQLAYQGKETLALLESVVQFVKANWLLLLGAFAIWMLSWLLTAMVLEMPTPADKNTRYAYWFRVLHRVVGALARARKAAKDPTVAEDDVAAKGQGA